MKIKDELAGKQVKCPKCANVFKADAPSAPAATPTQAGDKPAAWDKNDIAAKSKPTPEEEPPTLAKGATDSLDTELAKTTLSAEDRQKVVDEIGRREKVVWLGQPVPMIRFVRDAFVGF